jgi:cytochrome c-type biogenesis protein CcmH
LVGLLVGLVAVASASAQEPTPTPARRPSADDVNRVASQLYCPVCENEPLDVCQTAACVQWKAQIARDLAAGKSDEQIIQEFVADHGLRVLGTPPAEGINLILWVGPIVVALAGGAYAIILIRRMSQRRAPATTEPAFPPSSGDEYLDRVERELKQQL